MFKLQRSPSYWWPVTVAFAADGGKFEAETFEAQFVRLDTDAFKALMERVKADKLTDDMIVPIVMSNWRGVANADNQVVQFSPEATAQLCRLPGVAGAVVQAFLDSHTKAASGN